VPYAITRACIGVKDGYCARACPVGCIDTSPDSPTYYIDTLRCIDCTACRHVCPVGAIVSIWDLPPDERDRERINSDFFKH